MTTGRRWLVLLAALAGLALTTALGFWQWGRAQQKIALHEAMQARQALPPVPVAQWLAAPADPAFLHRAIELRGSWLPAHTVYLDNRQMAGGRPGFHVITPLRLAGRDTVVLVQRGWAPRDFQQRDRLPPVETPAGEVVVRGRLAPPPAKLYDFQGEERGPIRQNLDLERFRAETGLPLAPLTVQQAGPASEGLVRDWPQVASGADKNYGYAAQWWALAVLIAILYVRFQLLPARRQARRP